MYEGRYIVPLSVLGSCVDRLSNHETIADPYQSYTGFALHSVTVCTCSYGELHDVLKA